MSFEGFETIRTELELEGAKMAIFEKDVFELLDKAWTLAARSGPWQQGPDLACAERKTSYGFRTLKPRSGPSTRKMPRSGGFMQFWLNPFKRWLGPFLPQPNTHLSHSFLLSLSLEISSKIERIDLGEAIGGAEQASWSKKKLEEIVAKVRFWDSRLEFWV